MQHDAIIVGGSFAGLSAAMYLARTRKRVCVVDTGEPRNRFAARSHGFFAQDGSEPKLMLETMRRQVAAYPTVSFLQDSAVDALAEDGMFSVALRSGTLLTGKQLLLAFGISDEMPKTPGLAERWGTSVLHCPYCHGYEFADRQLGVLKTAPLSHHQATLIGEWGPTTLYLDGGELDREQSEALARRGVRIEPAAIDRLAGEGRTLSQIHLADGRSRPLDALFIAPRNRLNSALAERLGCALEAGPLGPTIVVDEMQMTSVPNVFAAGDIARKMHSVAFACADGVMAAIAMHRSLVFAGLS